MPKAIEVLMSEHRLIEQALGSLESYAAQVREGLAPGRQVIGEYAAFFRGFADTCHHGKEEDILFQRMTDHGLTRDAGPLAVMLHEHELGRAHVRALTGLASGEGVPSPRETAELLQHASGFVPLLRVHILKEDTILYPLALRMFTGPELDAMDSQFEAFETRIRADGQFDHLLALADRLTARFRPDPARMAEAANLSACGR